jgi:hypothetical protein
MKIAIGELLIKLMKMRKDAESWDPNGQMPWTDTTVVKDKGKRYKVEVKLNPKEEK